MESDSVLWRLCEVGDTVPNPTDILCTLLVKITAAQEGGEVLKTPFPLLDVHPPVQQTGAECLLSSGCGDESHQTCFSRLMCITGEVL